MAAFMTTAEVETITGRDFDEDETTRVSTLLELYSNYLRTRAAEVGKDLDEIVESDDAYESVLKLTLSGIVIRALSMRTEGDMVSQETQSANGYSWSGTYSLPGASFADAVLRNDLKNLGLRVQIIRGKDIYGVEGSND